MSYLAAGALPGAKELAAELKNKKAQEEYCQKIGAPDVKACAQNMAATAEALKGRTVNVGVIDWSAPSATAPSETASPGGTPNWLLYGGIALAGVVGVGLILRKRKKRSS